MVTSRGIRARKVKWTILAVLVCASLALVISPLGRHAFWTWRSLAGARATVSMRLWEHGPAARGRLRPSFAHAGVEYPPAELTLIGIKDRKELEVWARHPPAPFVHIRTYPILRASGHLGPKLRQGDCQVPEGLYEIESLHPNSRFHLALRVNYPNDDDRRRAQADGRIDLGSDIMIHGSNVSAGCLAMGDQAAEDLFVLVADTGLKNTQLILTPVDFRNAQLPTDLPELPAWTTQCYDDIRRQLDRFRPPPIADARPVAD